MDIEKRAQTIAREIIERLLQEEGPQIGEVQAVRVRTYADAETYAMLAPHPKKESWPLHRAINRHLAAGLAEHGVPVEFIVLEGGDYRRWLRGRPDTTSARHHYAEIMEHALPTFTSEPRTLH
jgi:hypothetical protein